MSGRNDHNTLWHYSNSHNKKFCILAVFKHPQRGQTFEEVPEEKLASWLLKEMNTMRSGIIKIPQPIMVISFYSHNAMWDKL